MGRLVVPQGRLERPTSGLGNRCSIHLSYWGTCYFEAKIAASNF